MDQLEEVFLARTKDARHQLVYAEIESALLKLRIASEERCFADLSRPAIVNHEAAQPVGKEIKRLKGLLAREQKKIEFALWVIAKERRLFWPEPEMAGVGD